MEKAGLNSLSILKVIFMAKNIKCPYCSDYFKRGTGTRPQIGTTEFCSPKCVNDSGGKSGGIFNDAMVDLGNSIQQGEQQGEGGGGHSVIKIKEGPTVSEMRVKNLIESKKAIQEQTKNIRDASIPEEPKELKKFFFSLAPHIDPVIFDDEKNELANTALSKMESILSTWKTMFSQEEDFVPSLSVFEQEIEKARNKISTTKKRTFIIVGSIISGLPLFILFFSFMMWLDSEDHDELPVSFIGTYYSEDSIYDITVSPTGLTSNGNNIVYSGSDSRISTNTSLTVKSENSVEFKAVYGEWSEWNGFEECTGGMTKIEERLIVNLSGSKTCQSFSGTWNKSSSKRLEELRKDR